MLKETWEKCIRPDGQYEGAKVCNEDRARGASAMLSQLLPAHTPVVLVGSAARYRPSCSRVQVTDDDVLELRGGGTGFAQHDKELQTKKRFLLGPGSGLADLRGQHASAPSKFGLSFNN